MRRLREREETLSNITGFGIKFQEAGGTHLLNMFDTNLGTCLHCARTPFPPSDTHSEGRDDCRARNVVYKSVCLTCNTTTNKKDTQDGGAGGREGVYVGDTSRSFHERAIEHYNDAKSFSQKSHQVKHWMISHPEEPIQPPFCIKKKRYRDCLSRQIGEALQIF